MKTDTMLIYRPVKATDFKALCHFAKSSGVGITTLPQSPALIKSRLNHAIWSFAQNTPSESGYYWFILEDATNHTPIGISAIESHVGLSHPFYSYKIRHETRQCPSLQLSFDDQVLFLSTDLSHTTELCTLYLDKPFRNKKIGHYLSRFRFLFISLFPERFNKKIIADLRGVSSERGLSPFWESLGKRFFNLSFKEADSLTLQTQKRLIADLMPTHPIYTRLLSQEAQKVIGKVHPASQGAYQILLSEGFRHGAYIDIFDAGPTLEAKPEQLHTIRHSKRLPIQIVETISSDGELAMVANTVCEDFRATTTRISLTKDKKSLYLSKTAASLLNLQEGDEIIFHKQKESLE